ncbi:MAG: histidyl-tRNA synthetase, partial [Bacteroidota bacterium]|nr:histidyl-tRNA synthetase [Bacteroidota bacterium]
PDPVKLKKQMSYADSRKIPFIIIAGEDELRTEEATIKIMASGEQKRVTFAELEPCLIALIKS